MVTYVNHFVQSVFSIRLTLRRLQSCYVSGLSEFHNLVLNIIDEWLRK